MTAYYNEIEPFAAAWLRNLIIAELIAPGDVDERSIGDVQPDDLRGYTQVHFFAGIGGWSAALRLADWADDRPVWTGSCPCQPFSVAGKRKGLNDERHLWPEMFRLIRECRPGTVFGEQVANASTWFDGVASDLEGVGYAVGAGVIPACAVNAPHRRDRLWFVGDASVVRRGEGRPEHGVQCGGPAASGAGLLGDARSAGLAVPERAPVPGARRWQEGRAVEQPSGSFWDGAEWLACGDGKARRVEPSIRLLVDGVFPNRVGLLRGFGNAIVPPVAAEFIAAFMEVRP